MPGVTICCIRRCRGSSRAKAAITAPVSPVRFRAGDLAAQDRDLVPQHQDLHVLGKRQMFGRAALPLLRKRVLLTAQT